jgi:hypothetical protein
MKKIHKLLVAVLVPFLVPTIVTSAEDEATIEEAMLQVYSGSRFDVIEATVAQCHLTLFLKDSEACAEGASIQSQRQFFDLRHFQAEYMVKYAKPINEMWRIRVKLTPIGEWSTRLEKLREEGERLHDSALAEYGPGHAAVIASSKTFREIHNIEEFHSLGSTEYCPMGEAIGPFARPTIQLQGTSINDTVSSFESLIRSCQKP